MSDFFARCQAAADEMAARRAEALAENERTGMTAMERFKAKCATLARQSTHRGIKDRARRMRADRTRLTTVHGELIHASGARAVAIASACVEREERMPRRWGGFGGEVPLLNARAALLLARWERRFERADAEVEAA